MIVSFFPKKHQRNGDRRSPPAIQAGMSLLDAVYHTAQAYPGGVAALAARMGMSPNTLQHKINTNNTTHKLSAAELEMIVVFTGDCRVTQALAARTGGVYMDAYSEARSTPVKQALAMVKDFGEVLEVVNEAVESGVVTPNKLRRCEREVAELMASLNTTLCVVRSMLPKVREA